MNLKKLAALLLLVLALPAHAAKQQQEGEPIKAPGDLPLIGFTGCAVSPPKDGCDARIVCHGSGTLFGNTGMDIQAATDDALMEAKSALAQFYNEKQKAQQSIAKVQQDVAKGTSDGGKSVNTSMTRLISSVRSNSAEAVLTGVQTLGRTVDVEKQTVTMKIGVSCKSQAAAAQSKATSAKSSSPASGSDSAKGGKEAPTKNDGEAYKLATNAQSTHQEVPNADNF